MKRQVTLILYIFADGSYTQIKAKIIFYSIPSNKRSKVEALEKERYYPGVTIEFNKTAYNNKELFSRFIDEELVPDTGVLKENPLLLIMDYTAFYKTRDILNKFKDIRVDIGMVLPRYTGLLQPLDTYINSLFKILLKEETELYINAREERLDCVEKWAISEKRVIYTHTVFNTLERLQTEKRDIITKSFRDTGVYMAPNKSKDHLMRIEGFEDKPIILGDLEYRDREIEGYEYRPIKVEPKDTFILNSKVEQTMDFLGLSVMQLKDCYKKRGIKRYSKWKRDELKEKLAI
jgi:hypothetical protein